MNIYLVLLIILVILIIIFLYQYQNLNHENFENNSESDKLLIKKTNIFNQVFSNSKYTNLVP